jgi:hypothetical protein
MSIELRKEESEKQDDSMNVVDGEKLSEPEVFLQQDTDAPQADSYPQADEYQEYRANYQQNMQQQNYGQSYNYGQQQGDGRQVYYGQQANRQYHYGPQGNGQPYNYGPRPNYGQQGDGPQQYYGQAERQKGDATGFGLTSMILGILSLLLFCSCINYILAILAIVFGIIQIVKNRRKGMAIAGIVTAGLSIVLATILWISFSVMTTESGGVPFNYYLEQYYDDDSAF